MKKVLVLAAVLSFAGAAMAQDVWLSDRGNLSTSTHQIHKWDLAGNYSGVSIAEVGAAQSPGSSWGYRDGATDGQYIYFGWEGGLARHDLDGSNGMVYVNGAAPVTGTWRALAYDPTLDSGNGGFWVGDFADNIVAVTRTGSQIRTLSGSWSLYGLDWDPTDGNLFGHTTGGAVIKINSTTGAVTPAWANGFPALSAQGGLSGKWVLGDRTVAVSQGTPDEYGVYNTGTGTLVGGPWNAEQLGGGVTTNGILGVAVTPEPTSLLLLGLAGLFIRRR